MKIILLILAALLILLLRLVGRLHTDNTNLRNQVKELQYYLLKSKTNPQEHK